MEITQVFLGNVLLALVTARVTSFGSYLDELSLVCQEKEQPLVGLFQRYLFTIRKRLVAHAAGLLSAIDPSALDSDSTQQDTLNAAINNLISAANGMEQLLLRTEVFPRGRPSSEAYDFTDSMIPSKFRAATGGADVTIELWPLYNFGVEPNLQSRIMEDLGFEPSGTSPRNVVLYLAEVEASNPLYWVFLAHEVGHYLEEELKLTQKVIGEIGPVSISPTWIKEFIADMIAVSIIGPAYFCGLVSVGVMSSDADKHYKTHPSLRTRAQMVVQALIRQMRADGDVSSHRHSWTETLDVDDLNRLPDWVVGFWRLLEKRRELERRDQALPECATLFHKIESSVLDNLGDVETRFIVSELPRCSQLAKHLRDNIPIGSYVDDDVRKKVNSRIAQLQWPTTTERASSSQDSRLCELKSILKSYVEYPTRPWQIVNAGWEDRWRMLSEWGTTGCQELLGKLRNSDPNDDRFLDEIMEYWGSNCERREALVRKSIAISSILGLFSHHFHGGTD